MKDLGFMNGGFRSGETFDAIGGVQSTPSLDETAEGVIGGEEIGIGEGDGEFSDGTGGVFAGEEPSFNGVAIVGDTGGESYRVFHDLEGDGAEEIVWDFDLFIH